MRWTVEDPERRVSAMTADLNLLVEGPPTLVDFANNTVCAALKRGQRIQLSADLQEDVGFQMSDFAWGYGPPGTASTNIADSFS